MLNQDYIELDLGRQNSTLAQNRINTLLQRNDVKQVFPIQFNALDQYLNAGFVTFAHPLQEQMLTFIIDALIDHTDYSAPIPDTSYSIIAYGEDGSVLEINRRGSDYGGFIRLEISDELYKVNSLAPDETFLIEMEPGMSVYNNNGNICGTDHTGPLDSIYFQPPLTTRSCKDGEVNILFLTTTGVAAVMDPEIVANDIIAEMNFSAANSNVEFLYRMAAVDEFSSFTQTSTGINAGADLQVDLNNIEVSAEFIELREFHNADLVVVFVSQPYADVANTIFGSARDIASDREQAFAIAEILASAMGFTATHEIAHLLGARHQRCNICLVNGCDNQTRHHGFLVGATNQTIMAQLGCGANRVARFSDRDALFFGDDTGNFWNQNSRIITRCSGRAACFENGLSPWAYSDQNELYVGIQGSTVIADCDTEASWSAVIDEGFSAPISYWWEWSALGVGPWNYLGNSETVQITNLSVFPDYFMLRLKVDDVDHYGQAQKSITRVFCLTEEEKSSDRSQILTKLIYDIKIYNLQGCLIDKRNMLQHDFSNKNIAPGIYIQTYIDANGKPFSKKVSIF